MTDYTKTFPDMIVTGIIAPKRMNRFRVTITYVDANGNEIVLGNLGTQVISVSSEHIFTGAGCMDMVFEDDIHNFCIKQLIEAHGNELTVQIEHLDLEDVVVTTWTYTKCFMGEFTLCNLDYSSGEPCTVSVRISYTRRDFEGNDA